MKLTEEMSFGREVSYVAWRELVDYFSFFLSDVITCFC